MFREKMFGTTSRICFDQDNGGGGGGSTNDSDSKDNGGGEATPQWVKDLQETMKGVGLGMQELVGMAKAARQTVQPATDDDGGEGEGDDEPEDEVDLEGLSRAQFAEVVTKKIINAVNKQVVSPLSKKMNGIASQTQQSDLKRQVEITSTEKGDDGQLLRPDFWEWKDEMVALATQHPTLTPKQLYKMVREDDPEKLAKMEEKYKIGSKKPKGDGDGTPGKIKISFGGFTPNGPSGGRKSDAGTKMSPREAANSAWDETVKSMGGEPLFGDDG